VGGFDTSRINVDTSWIKCREAALMQLRIKVE
jgi:hypothetical protein